MSHPTELEERSCPVCRSRRWYHVLLEERLPASSFGDLTYASRKEPEFMSWRMVECADCGLAYAPVAPSAAALEKAYATAGFDSREEADGAAETYARLLQRDVSDLDRGAMAVEIGAGTGAFLAHLQSWGFQKVVGFEPSTAAIAEAPTGIRRLIIAAPFEASSVASGTAAFFGCFMTLEHVSQPRELVEAATEALVPGGTMAIVVHDRTAALNRLLGRRSPIVDVEHLQLFSPSSLRRLLALAGLEAVSIRHFSNTYRLGYWIKLMPIPVPVKRTLQNALGRLANVRVTLPVGNMIAVGRKPTTVPRGSR